MKNYSLYGLPQKIEFCKKCVISNQRPNSVVEYKNKSNQKDGINIENGCCDACNYNSKKKKINWIEREKQLQEIFKKYRKSNGEYDCVVPSSGGKDSSFTAHILKNKYGMNPLTVTWSPMMWTNEGLQNFHNLSNIGGIDSILHTPRGDLHRFLTRQAFLNLCHPFQPFIHGQKIIGPKYAHQMNINLVIYGENQAEYGNKVTDNEQYLMNDNFFSLDDNEKFENLYLSGTKISNLIKNCKFKISDFSSYIPLKKSEIKEKKIKMLYLGYFEKWDPQENFYYACENTGFRPSDERSEGTYSKYTEIDDKMVPIHFYTTYIKFGIGRATYDACQEIRNKKITRDEGVNLVKKFDNEFPSRSIKDFLEYIDVSEDQFHKTIDSFRSPHLWTKKNRKWKLKYQVK